jgi:outer membrane protein TolC
MTTARRARRAGGRPSHAPTFRIALWAVVLTLLVGCSRRHYRRDADAETYCILEEKTAATPWALPPGFSIEPDARSRLFDPSEPDCPTLPLPQPQLHRYTLPQPATAADSDAAIRLASHSVPDPSQSRNASGPSLGQRSAEGRSAQQASQATSSLEYAGGLPLVPVPTTFWQAVPPECLARMLEFQSVRDEYQRSFAAPPGAELLDPARRLTLDDLIELAQRNSREYQTQKETLYRAALALSLERFDYDLKFSATGNSTAVNYDHSRTGGRTVNTLGIPTRLQMDKTLATAGELLARFANDVVLTFNGPDGFAADVSSELFFRLSQPVFQRDIRFEPLVRTERNVIYAVRDFTRFRKTFFFQRASEYYALVRNYRQIEIEAQNYFSLVRALDQAEAEERAGLQSRIQVEQIEQSMLQGRSRLITTCNGLENSFDRLKLSLGLPTELPINLDLKELEQLTLRDEVEVTGERVRRSRRRLDVQRQKQPPDRSEVLSAATVLAERLLQWLSLRQRLGQEIPSVSPLEELRARLRVDEARLDANRDDEELLKARRADPPSPPLLLFQRTMDSLDAMLELLTRQLELAARLGASPDARQALEKQREELANRAGQLRARLESVLREAKLGELEALLRDAERLLEEVQGAARSADQLSDVPAEQLAPDQQQERTIGQADELLRRTDELLQATHIGLAGIEIDCDDAMLTALAERLDLMNERGRLADDRRAIKLAADDLKSVMNLNASETIRTQKNRPFGFDFDESRTQLSMTLDLPLNRKVQRNAYRLALIDYQAALRSLAAAEDNIKLAVRNDQRDLALARVQYLISVASAALAAERVLSTRLELALGFPGVAARDFLEAQDDYRAAVGAVADNHIGYLVDRTQFFLDLELMQLDASGFWRELYDEQFQPAARHSLRPNAGPAYGDLPEFLWLSDEIRCIGHEAR